MDVITKPTDEWLRKTFPLGPVTLDPASQAQLALIVGAAAWIQDNLVGPMVKGHGDKGTIEWMVKQRMQEAKDLAEPTTPDGTVGFSVEDYAYFAGQLNADEWALSQVSLWLNRNSTTITQDFTERVAESKDPSSAMLPMLLQMAPASFPLAMAVGIVSRALHFIVCRSICNAHPEVRFDFGHHVMWKINTETVAVEITGYRSDMERMIAAQAAEKTEAAVFGTPPSAN